MTKRERYDKDNERRRKKYAEDKSHREAIQAKNRDKYRTNTRAILDSKKRRYANNRTDTYSVYYLPEEHYVGMTNAPLNRIQRHKSDGKDIEGFTVLREFNNPFDAHIYETQWHSIGARGFHMKYNL